MNHKDALVVALIASSLGLSGCPVVLVGAGAAGGYALSKDSAKSNFDLPKDRIYKRSLDVVKEMGQVTMEDEKHGLIKASITDVNVTITVKQLTKKTVELKVKARDKFLVPKVALAQEVYTKIIEKL